MVKFIKYSIVTIFICSPLLGMAQKEWSVYGKVVDVKNDRPINAITITNPRSRTKVATNSEGNFYIRAADGDSLIANGVGFGRHGILWRKGMKNIIIKMNVTAIALEEVVVTDKKSKTLEQEIKRFLENTPTAAALKKDIKGDIVSVAPMSSGGSGMGISIDALYELWSKEGKNRRKVAQLEYNDIKDYYISLRYNERKVANITKLQGEDLKDFMSFCTIPDDFVLEASDYDLTYRIFSCYREFTSSSFPRLR